MSYTAYELVILGDNPVSYVPCQETAFPNVDIIQSVSDGGSPNPTYNNPSLAALGVSDQYTARADIIYFTNPFHGTPSSRISMEAWVKTTDSVGGNQQLYCNNPIVFADVSGQGVSNDFGCGFYSNMYVTAGFGSYSFSDTGLSSSTALNDGHWHHVVVTYDGSSSNGSAQTGTAQIYIDGVLDTSASSQNTGPRDGNANWWSCTNGGGWLGNICHIALYNYVLSATQISNHFNAGNPPVVCAPYWNNVSLLLHFDGANSQTVTTDSGPYNFPATRVNNASLSTTTPKFGTACGNFVDSSGGGWNFPITVGGPLDLHQAPFTVECWFRSTKTSGDLWSDNSVPFTSNDVMRMYMTGGTTLTLQCNYAVGGGNASSLTATPNDGNWHHVVASASSNACGVALDGVWGSINNAYTFAGETTTEPFFSVGYDEGDRQLSNGQGWVGQIDELRVTKGIVRYPLGTNFTPPSYPNPQISCSTQVQVAYVGSRDIANSLGSPGAGSSSPTALSSVVYNAQVLGSLVGAKPRVWPTKLANTVQINRDPV